MKPVLVGEQNPYGADPHFALYPLPSTSAGGRLCYRILGMREVDYLRSFDRRNLLDTSVWTKGVARRAAEELEAAHKGAPIIMLGKRVAEAFRLGDLGEFTWVERPYPVIRLPHPSGRCRAWDRPGAIDEARRILRDLLPAGVTSLIGKYDKVAS